MIVERYWPAIGGVEKHVRRLAQELIDRGWQVRIITKKHEGSLKSTETVDGVEIHRIPKWILDAPPLAYLWLLKNQHLWKHADVVHVHDTVPLLLWGLPLVITRRARPVSVTFHGYERDPIPVAFRLLRRVARYLTGERSICIGRFIERCYGIDCGRVTLGAVERPTVSIGDKQGLVYVGRIEPDTGILEYLKSLLILRDEFGIEQRLTVIGDGTLRRQAEEFAERNDLAVEFRGAIREPWRVAGSAKICLAVGFLSILESMSLGIPVVSFATSPLRVSYLRSVLDANGPISIQTTPEGVAREIARLERNPQLYQKIAESGKAFAKRFSWSSLTETYLRLWSNG